MRTWRDTAALIVIVGIITADFSTLSVYRGLTVGDVLLLLGFTLAVSLGTPLQPIPLWYWILALSFSATTIVAQLTVPAGLLGAWALHSYFYLAVLPIAWSLLAANAFLFGQAAVCVFVIHVLAAAEVLLRISRFNLAWWTGPAVSLFAGLTSTVAFAIALLLGIGLLLREFVQKRRVLLLILITSGICILAAGIVVGNKRTVWGAATVALVAILVFAHRRFTRALLTLAAASAVGGLLFLQAPVPLRSRVAVSVEAVLHPGKQLDSSYSARLLAQQRVLTAFFDGPWPVVFFGYGYRQSGQYVGPELVASSTGMAHNTFVNYLVETGLAGVLPLAALWTLVLLSAILVWIRAREALHHDKDPSNRRAAADHGVVSAASLIIFVELLFAPDVFLRLGFFVAGAVFAFAHTKVRH